MSKYFLVNPNVEFSSKEVSEQVEKGKLNKSDEIWKLRESQRGLALEKKCPLKFVSGRVIVMVDMEKKNYYRFANGLNIRRERRFNNFNFREVNPSNGIVISAENIPENSEVLIDYTAIHDSNKIFSYNTGSPDIQFYSIKEEYILAWRQGQSEWQPTKNSEFALRVFKPYEGYIDITPLLLNDVLLITTGSLKGSICNTIKASDYQIVFTSDDGKEGNLIRVKHSDDSEFDKEEIICINHELTELYQNGKLKVGLTANDATYINN